MKIAGAEGMVFTGTARPFDSENDAFDALTAGTIAAGDVIVIRYEGPKGSPGHARDARRHGGRRRRRPGQGRRADHGRALQRRHEGLLTSATSRPRRSSAGPIALIEDGDQIVIDADARRIDLQVDEATLAARRGAWKAPEPRYTSGALAKYAKLVGSADHGAVTG